MITRYLRLATAVLALILCCGACRRDGSQTGRMQRVSLRQEWVPWMGYAGEAAANDQGFFTRELTVEIRPGGLENDPIRLVSTGVDQFGVAGAERVLAAREQGAPLVVIGVVNPRSPSVFITLERSPIRTPADFRGRTIGVLTGSNTEVVYRALLARTGVDRRQLRELEISYDIPGFIRGNFDVLPAFAFDEPVTLRRQNVTFRVIDPTAYGVRAIGNVYFTTRRMVETQPEVVQRFVTGVVRGWRWAFEHPREAIALVRRLDPNLDASKEEESLRLSQPYFQPAGTRLLEIRRTDWDAEVQVLRSIGNLRQPAALDAALAPQFVERALQAN